MKQKYQIEFTKFSSIILLVLISFIGIYAQNQLKEDSDDLRVIFNSAKLLPSMVPVVTLKIGYGGVLANPAYLFAENRFDSYIIVKNNGNPNNSADRIQIKNLDISIKGVTYISVDAKANGLKEGDDINIGLKLKKRNSSGNYDDFIIWNGTTDDNDKVIRKITKVPKTQLSTVQLKPEIVPEQELIDGTKKMVGQLQIKIDVPALIKNTKGANLYFKTDNTISTNWKDKNSKVEAKLGLERNLNKNWYIPAFVEAKINGDQRFKNSTFVFSTGVKTNLPWRKTKPLLFNSYIKAPVSPIFEFSSQYHRRLRQDNTAQSERLDKNAFALFSQINWQPIQILPGKCGNKDETNDGCLNEISLELSAKGWYFPYEKAIPGIKVKKFEGRVEASLLIPFSKFDAFGFNAFKTSEDGVKTRLRITYRDGANDANGFKRSNQFLFGIEAIK